MIMSCIRGEDLCGGSAVGPKGRSQGARDNEGEEPDSLGLACQEWMGRSNGGSIGGPENENPSGDVLEGEARTFGDPEVLSCRAGIAPVLEGRDCLRNSYAHFAPPPPPPTHVVQGRLASHF